MNCLKSFFSKRGSGAYRLYGVGKNRLAKLTLFDAKEEIIKEIRKRAFNNVL